MKMVGEESGYSKMFPPEKFVYLSDTVPEAMLEIRYYSTYNFVGERIDGYERPVALLTVEAARALREVCFDVAERNLRLKVYDAYRPQRAVRHFVRWAKKLADTRMKAKFYPDMDKSELFERGFIAEKSGHSRGSTVDLTLCDAASGEELDMGGTFDRFGPESRPDWCGDCETGAYTGKFSGGRAISEAQFRNRMLLRAAMLRRGFRPLAEEWWHFTLADEPYPDTYFDCPVR